MDTSLYYIEILYKRNDLYLLHFRLNVSAGVSPVVRIRFVARRLRVRSWVVGCIALAFIEALIFFL